MAALSRIVEGPLRTAQGGPASGDAGDRATAGDRARNVGTASPGGDLARGTRSGSAGAGRADLDLAAPSAIAPEAGAPRTEELASEPQAGIPNWPRAVEGREAATNPGSRPRPAPQRGTAALDKDTLGGAPLRPGTPPPLSRDAEAAARAEQALPPAANFAAGASQSRPRGPALADGTAAPDRSRVPGASAPLVVREVRQTLVREQRVERVERVIERVTHTQVRVPVSDGAAPAGTIGAAPAPARAAASELPRERSRAFDGMSNPPLAMAPPAAPARADAPLAPARSPVVRRPDAEREGTPDRPRAAPGAPGGRGPHEAGSAKESSPRAPAPSPRGGGPSDPRALRSSIPVERRTPEQRSAGQAPSRDAQSPSPGDPRRAPPRDRPALEARRPAADPASPAAPRPPSPRTHAPAPSIAISVGRVEIHTRTTPAPRPVVTSAPRAHEIEPGLPLGPFGGRW